MNGSVLVGGAVLLLVLAVLLHWQLNLAEGVYLGSRAVVWLYDRFAPRYDRVKQFSERDEAHFLGEPLARALRGVATSLVLDVATGTARLPLALFRQPTFTGRVVALDLSREMLRQAAANTSLYQDRLTLLWQDATWLPFPDGVFHAVTCIEALEFLPDARATLAEMARVLRPGGILLITNRTGPGVRWMPGRTMTRQDLTALLESLALEKVNIAVWQIDYDMAWARKPIARPGVTPDQVYADPFLTLPDLLRCPKCARGSRVPGTVQPLPTLGRDSRPLTRRDRAFNCEVCGSDFPLADDGVVELAH